MGLVAILILIAYYSYRHYQKNQGDKSNQQTTTPEKKENITGNDSVKDDSSSEVKHELNPVGQSDIEKIVTKMIKRVDYFKPTMRFQDLVWLIETTAQDQKVRFKDRFQISDIIDKIIYHKMLNIFNDVGSPNYGEFLKLFSLLSDPQISDYITSFGTGDDESFSPVFYQNIDYFLLKALGADNICDALQQDESIPTPVLKDNEHLYWVTDVEVYESKAVSHSVGYNGYSGSFAGMHAGSYDYKRESYSEKTLTMSGNLYVTDKRLIVEGWDEVYQREATKTWNLSSITDYTIETDDSLQIQRSGSPFSLKLDDIIDHEAGKIALKSLNIVLDDLLRGSENGFIWDDFGLHLGKLTYVPNYDNKLQDLYPQIISIFDGHIVLENDPIFNDTDEKMFFKTNSLEDSMYFRKLILGGSFDEWLNKLIDVIQAQFKYLHFVIFSTDDDFATKYDSAGIKIIDVNTNYINLMSLMAGGDGPINLTQYFSDYKNANPVYNNKGRFSIDGLTDSQELLKDKLFLYEFEDSGFETTSIWYTFRDAESKTYFDEKMASKNDSEIFINDFAAVNNVIMNFCFGSNHKGVGGLIDLVAENEQELVSSSEFSDQSAKIEDTCLLLFNSEGTFTGGILYNEQLKEKFNANKKVTAQKDSAPAQNQHNSVKESTNLDKFEEIKKYKDLLDNGIINQSEFDKKKHELLGL
ncbi:SHOCT domain-containing protein [Secundilactobacillus yichangensis]|uniref:SHOCT domain-containing protein n=1 Tax=Secundilactobacillus yichangensis TaxID=2799580 RepID=UPI001F236EB4